MHRHYTDQTMLRPLAKKFTGGEVVLIKGRGKGSEVYCGKVEKIEVRDDRAQTVAVHCSKLFKRQIGCNADFSRTIRWEEIPPPPQGIVLNYSWYYTPKKGTRLKLESVEANERCWLCSHENPIYLALFRATLMKMFLEESLEKESRMRNWFRSLRNRIVLLC